MSAYPLAMYPSHHETMETLFEQIKANPYTHAVANNTQEETQLRKDGYMTIPEIEAKYKDETRPKEEPKRNILGILKQ